MEEIRWWSRLLLVSAIISVVVLMGGPLGYKFGVAPLLPSLMSLLLALVVAVLVFVVSLVMVIVANKKGLVTNRNYVVVALLISLVPMVAMTPQLMKGRSVPPIHDISTDTTNPPGYDVVVSLRKSTENSLAYGAGENMSAEKLAGLTMKSYPDVKSLRSSLSVEDAVVRAEQILDSQGLEVVNVDADAGIVEAVATTFWFGFKDDVVVRVTEDDSGSIVDVRSVSRVGVGDVGANAARIEKFLKAF